MTPIHKVKWFTLSVIALLFVITVIQNTGSTSLRFIGWQFEISRMILIFGVGLGGFVAGILSVLLIQRDQHHFQSPPPEPPSHKEPVPTRDPHP